jgi:hydroxypyruvate isomerase
MKLSVCIDAVFYRRDFMESMKDVKEVGINAFEFWSWWDKDLEKIQQTKNELDLEISAFCTRMISLVDISKRDQYLKGLEESIEVAKRLNCKNLITQVGNELPNISREKQHQTLVEGLKECVPLLERSNITLLMEPLNTLIDHKGYYLFSSDEAFQIIEEVNSPCIKVLYDIYHQQIMEGHLIYRITHNIEKIGHFHAAGNPGRHELTTGEIHYKNIIKAIEEAGYKGYFGLEYFPIEEPIKGLKEVPEWM